MCIRDRRKTTSCELAYEIYRNSGKNFFIPDYEKDRMLVCHIGEKLPTVN